MRVMLTGASGFIGSRAVAPLVAAGHEVHAVIHSREQMHHVHGKRLPDARWHQADLLDEHDAADLVDSVRPEALLHLAWYAKHGRFWTAAENLDWVAATLRLLRHFREAGGARAVVAGSCAEYLWGAPELSESSTPLRPATLYGAAKHATHITADAYCRESGLALAWGRIFFVYGPGEDPARLVPSIVRALLAGREAQTTAGRQVRDFLYVQDVAAAFVALLDSAVTGAVNVASGEPVEVRKLVELIGATIGRPELIRLGALPQRPGDPDVLVADVRRLRQEVGFHARTTLREGVEKSVAWWRERAALATVAPT